VLWWLACVHPQVAEVDLGLVDKVEARPAQTPEAVLLDFAASDDPTLRGRALAWLVVADPAQFAARGLHDPDGWVQSEVARAMVGDASQRDTLLNYVGRDDSLVDPYVQGSVALALGATALPRLHPSGRGWRAAPLWFARLSLGDPAAEAPLAEVLRSGELPLESELFRDIGRSGQSSLLPALAAGQIEAEAELQPAYAAARAGLGDAGGDAVLRALLADGEMGPLGALDLLAPPLSGPVVARLLAEAARSNDTSTAAGARAVQAAAGTRGVDAVERALAHPDRDVRLLALGLVAAGDARLQKNARRWVRRAVADPDATVQIAALVAAQRLRLSGLEDVALPLFDSDDPRLRLEASGVIRARIDAPGSTR
jgi:hypothetical protein